MTKLKVITGIFAAVLLIFGGFFSAGSAVQAVNYDVTKASDDGSVGTLRWAITQANILGSGANTIYFKIPISDPKYDSTNGWWKITLDNSLGALPSLADNDNGTTIFGYNTPSGLSEHDILIDGSLLGGSMSILTIESDYNIIQGLTLANAPGAGINIITEASNNIISDSYFGTDPNGLLDWGNATGIKISSGASNNTIDQCVISGNDENGVLITGDNTNYNILQRTIIGLNASGTGKIPNGWDGVHITNGADHNTIGGELPTDDGRGNVISGNNQRGAYLSGENTIYNSFVFNYIGVTKSGGGTPDVGNLSHGIMLEDGPDANSILFNVISGNKEHGIYLRGTGTSQTWISENIIGADPELKAIIPNHKHGVAVYDGAYRNYVGGHSWMKGNVIVGSGWSGIAVVGSWDNEINNNVIGTDRQFSLKKMGNKYHGIDIVNSRENEIWENYIAYNGTYAVRAGIEVKGTTAISNTISMNSIHDNSGGGIDLVDGGNRNLPAPLITAAGCTIVQGVTNCLGCRIEIFSDGGAEGKHYEGYTIATSPTAPNFIWGGTVRGPNVTVTATDYKWWDATDYKNTSEFSLPWLGACHTIYLPVTFKNY